LVGGRKIYKKKKKKEKKEIKKKERKERKKERWYVGLSAVLFIIYIYIFK
jgi:hypothetical protein